MAVGTRTAPAFTAAAQARHISLGLIDTSGDLWSEPLPVAVGATAAAIEAFAAAYTAATQASLYMITDVQIRLGDMDASNAGSDFRAQMENGVNLLFKNPTTLDTDTPRLIAPIAAVMQGFQDIPLLASAELAALITAILALKTGYSLNSGQYTGRRERRNNPRIVT